MQKSTIISILLITHVICCNAQVIQHGIVKEYNEELQKTPLANVEILVSDAGQRVSGNDGKFQLRFRTKKLGDHVSVTRIEKLGYEIFNRDAIAQWNVSDADHPFTIVMCNSEKFKKIRDNYERVSSESYARQQLKEKKKLEAERAAGKLKEEEFQQKLVQLQDEFDRQLDSIRPYIDRFARIDLSEISEQERKIIKLIQEGNIDEGIELYKQLNPEGIFRNNRKLKTQLDVSADSVFAMICRKNDALFLQGGRDNLKKVEESYRDIAEADTTYLYGLSAYSDFLFQRHRHQENLRYLHLINMCGEKSFPHYLSAMYHATGYAYYCLGNYDEANLYFQKSKDANKKYNRNDSITYMENLAIHYGDMANILNYRGEYAEEEVMREKECEIMANLSRIDMKRYGSLLQGSLFGLMQFYVGHNPEKVESIFEKMEHLYSLAIYEDKAELQRMEAMLLSARVIIAHNDDTQNVELQAKDALKFIEPLYIKDEELNYPIYGSLLSMLGMQYYKQGKLQDAQPYLLKALSIYDKFMDHNPRMILPTLIPTQCALGAVNLKYGYVERADSIFDAAYDNCKKMESLQIDNVNEMCVYLFSRFNCSLELEKDEDIYKYLQMIRDYNDVIEEKYGENASFPDLWHVFYNLGMLRFKQKYYEKAENCFFQCCIYSDESVSEEEKINARHCLIELYTINGHYDDGIRFVNYLLENSEGKERLWLLHEKGVYYLKKGDTKKAQKIWNTLKKTGISWVSEDSPLLKKFGK